MHRLKVSNVIDFRGKGCKDNDHQKCYGTWIGLGFQVVCNCLCHHNKKIIDTKWEKMEERSTESNRIKSKSVVVSNAKFFIDNEVNVLKKNIEPVDKSLRGSSQQVPFAKGKE
jgi:hypothetical protein